MKQQEDTIIKNWESFKSYILKTEDKNLLSLINHLEERLMVCPASTKLEFACAYPGGLVEHSLRVLNNMFALVKAYQLESSITPSSIIKVALLHDLGKVGSENFDYYFDQDSDWHRTKLGQMYEVNQKLAYMPVSQRSLFWLATSNVSLTEDEWNAIASIRPLRSGDESVPNNEPIIAVLLQQAVKMACISGKNSRQVRSINT